MESQRVKAVNYQTCICGKVCKGNAALFNHSRVCPVERARSDAFVNAIETSDWSAYKAAYGWSPA